MGKEPATWPKWAKKTFRIIGGGIILAAVMVLFIFPPWDQGRKQHQLIPINIRDYVSLKRQAPAKPPAGLRLLPKEVGPTGKSPDSSGLVTASSALKINSSPQETSTLKKSTEAPGSRPKRAIDDSSVGRLHVKEGLP
jgi:hypothetical protein